MLLQKISSIVKLVFQFFRRKTSILLFAFMLGVSNVIMEETRMINDSRKQTEQKEMVSDDDFLDEESDYSWKE